MKKQVDIFIDNKLSLVKREINVYHHFTGNAYIVGYNSTVKLFLKAGEEDDYLDISIAGTSGRINDSCVMDLPSWIDFYFSGEGDISVRRLGKRTQVTLPAGIPLWRLKLSHSLSFFNFPISGQVIIGTGQQEILS